MYTTVNASDAISKQQAFWSWLLRTGSLSVQHVSLASVLSFPESNAQPYVRICSQQSDTVLQMVVLSHHKVVAVVAVVMIVTVQCAGKYRLNVCN